MNSFRSSVLGGTKRPAPESLMREKNPRGVQPDALDSIPVERHAIRAANHRDDDRHRLSRETATARFRNDIHPVEIVNLSGGGAMIQAGFAPNMWERVDLTLGEGGTVECAVRWIRGQRIGLEFAHETQIEGDPAQRDAMLLDVIRRSFPDLPALPQTEQQRPAMVTMDASDFSRREEQRHPLIWTGTVLFNHDVHQVRLRNVSARGALIESALSFPVDADVYLDLGEAGNLFATVSWARGDQVGLRFAQPFDIADLARARPDLAPQRWSMPEYLRGDQNDISPWADQWKRMSVQELKSSLEGFLKH
jgi:hypothetical protein